MSSLWRTQDDLHHPISQSKGSQTEKLYVRRWTKGKSHQRHVPIDVLPDDVLLEIFDCCMKNNPHLNAWHVLVHVSRNWRSVVFNSPHRLNLQLLFSGRTPVREMLVLWPPLPIVIDCYPTWNEDNIITALEHYDRVCKICLCDISSSLLERLLEAMQEPFPALESLILMTRPDVKEMMAPVVSDSFLGGSAPTPHLRSLQLVAIPFPFPGLRKLLLSATDLVALTLYTIPHSGYFSPEAIATCLSALTRLKTVEIGFESPRSRPYRENRRPRPPTRTLLPALRSLIFTGVSEYLEDLVARIDAPLLDKLEMRFFHQLIFDTPQLAQFISVNSRIQRDEVPKEAHVAFGDWHVYVTLPAFANGLRLEISCGELDWQVSALEQFCRLSFPRDSILAVEHLYIMEDIDWDPYWHDVMDNSQWLELLHPFIGVKNLFLSTDFAPRIALALQELVGERVYDVLPVLQSINLEGFDSSGVAPEGIGHFVDARHFSSPVAIVSWTRQIDKV